VSSVKLTKYSAHWQTIKMQTNCQRQKWQKVAICPVLYLVHRFLVVLLQLVLIRVEHDGNHQVRHVREGRADHLLGRVERPHLHCRIVAFATKVMRSPLQPRFVSRYFTIIGRRGTSRSRFTTSTDIAMSPSSTCNSAAKSPLSSLHSESPSPLPSACHARMLLSFSVLASTIVLLCWQKSGMCWAAIIGQKRTGSDHNQT
jgi:hypothetical protein